jgi:tRNA(Ile)-lysidine synthase
MPVVALAQHANDQAETVLLQLLRGAGPKGMAGMGSLGPIAGLQPASTPWLWRPLLGVSRAAIEQYASLSGIEWVEDESNANENLTRNRLRKRVMPALEAAFPQALSTIGRSARNLADAALLCQELADVDMANVRLGADKLAVSGLQALPTHRLKNLLRRWFDALGLRAPSETRLSALVRALYQTNNDTRLTWIHDGWQIERKKGELRAARK